MRFVALFAWIFVSFGPSVGRAAGVDEIFTLLEQDDSFAVYRALEELGKKDLASAEIRAVWGRLVAILEAFVRPDLAVRFTPLEWSRPPSREESGRVYANGAHVLAMLLRLRSAGAALRLQAAELAKLAFLYEYATAGQLDRGGIFETLATLATPTEDGVHRLEVLIADDSTIVPVSKAIEAIELRHPGTFFHVRPERTAARISGGRWKTGDPISEMYLRSATLERTQKIETCVAYAASANAARAAAGHRLMRVARRAIRDERLYEQSGRILQGLLHLALLENVLDLTAICDQVLKP